MFYLKLDFGRATINMLVLKMLSKIEIIWCVT